MQPTLCSRCKKNVAVVFISKIENGQTINEGLCLKCAKELGLPQVNDMMKRMGISDEDLEALNDEMMQAFGGAENIEDLPGGEDGDETRSDDGKTATFPFLNRLFRRGRAGTKANPAEEGERVHWLPDPEQAEKAPKHKYLDSYCINLSRAGPGRQAGQGGRPGGGDRAGHPDPQPPPEEQPLPHRRARRG